MKEHIVPEHLAKTACPGKNLVFELGVQMGQLGPILIKKIFFEKNNLFFEFILFSIILENK